MLVHPPSFIETDKTIENVWWDTVFLFRNVKTFIIKEKKKKKPALVTGNLILVEVNERSCVVERV